MSDYRLEPVTTSDADIVEMASLLRVVFPHAGHFTDEALAWQYRDNPDGQVVGYNAWAGDVLAAHYVTIPFAARYRGQEERGLLSLNTATHPAHQGKGLFTRLAKATYALAAEQGFGSVSGVANASSTHGFIRKLGFQLVSPLRAMIGLGPLPRRDPPTEVEFEHAWTPASLKWRTAHPAYRYYVKQSGDLGLVLSERHQFGARYVLGAFSRPLLDDGLPVERRAVNAKVWIGLDPAMHWSARPYINIPARFRPSPLNFIFRDLTEQGRKLDVMAVRWQAMDFDIL